METLRYSSSLPRLLRPDLLCWVLWPKISSLQPSVSRYGSLRGSLDRMFGMR
jgi:hypothetical protein